MMFSVAVILSDKDNLAIDNSVSLEKIRERCQSGLNPGLLGFVIDHFNYMHNWTQDYGLACHITHVVWVNFRLECRDLQFKVNFKRQKLLRNFFMTGLFTLRVFDRNLLRGCRRINIFFSYFAFGVWPGLWTHALRLISKHTAYETTCGSKLKRHFVWVNFTRESRLQTTHFWETFLWQVYLTSEYLAICWEEVI